MNTTFTYFTSLHFSFQKVRKKERMMKFLLLAVATLCAKASDVVVLNGDNFEEEVYVHATCSVR